MTIVASGDYRPLTSPRALPASDFKLDSIDLYLTSACNRRCTYCFLPDEFLNSKSRMSLAMAREVVGWAAASGTVREITLLGGEPALHPQFREIVTEVSAAGLSARTVTNGSRRFRDALGMSGVGTSLERIAVSLDATTPDRFDLMRGPHAYADAIATIDELRRLGIPFEINYTVVRSNLDDVPAMIRLAERLGATRLNMHWFSLVGRARKHAADEVVPALEWRDRVLAPVHEYHSPRADFVVDCELGYAYGLPGEDINACAVRGLTNLQFFPSGSVFACGMLVEDDQRSAYLWQDGKLQRRVGSSELSETESQCAGCPLRARDGEFLPLCIYNRLTA